MNDPFLIENKYGTLTLSDEEIQHIQQLNYYLGANKGNFNNINYFSKNKMSKNNHDETTSIIIKNIGKLNGNPFIELKTENKVGVLHSGLQPILVRPKIDESHFMYIIDKSLQIRLRSKNEKVQFTDYNSNSLLLNYFLKAFLNSLNEYIRSWGIHTDYEKVNKKSNFLKGNINYINTYLDVVKGKTIFNVTIHELTGNTPINRLIKQAVFKLRKTEFAETNNIKLFTTRILQHFQYVDTSLKNTDITEAIIVSRTSTNLLLKNVIDFSLIILNNTFFYPLRSGNNNYLSFLIDSPILIEDGLREIIKDSLKQKKGIQVSKTSKQINFFVNDFLEEDLAKTATPDILIKSKSKTYVLDVKYKLIDTSSNNLVYESDMYQLAAYIDIFQAEFGIIIAFSKTSTNDIISFKIGEKIIYLIFWSLNEKGPTKSSNKLINQIQNLIYKH